MFDVNHLVWFDHLISVSYQSLKDVSDFYEYVKIITGTNDEDINKVRGTRFLSMMVEVKSMCRHVLTCIYVVTFTCIYFMEYVQEIDKVVFWNSKKNCFIFRINSNL